MNEQEIDKHSVNCYFCGELVDERDCVPADEFNDNDGGDCCRCCAALLTVAIRDNAEPYTVTTT
jgi:hypothetical protein